jgi:hypothetical protein
MTNKTKQKLKKMNFLGQRRIEPMTDKYKKLIGTSDEDIHRITGRTILRDFSKTLVLMQKCHQRKNNQEMLQEIVQKS